MPYWGVATFCDSTFGREFHVMFTAVSHVQLPYEQCANNNVVQK